MDYKIILGSVASAIAFISYVPYVRDTLSHKTKPHIFTWLIWTLLNAIAFTGQTVGHAGPGAWVTGFTTLMCLLILLLSWRTGKKDIVAFDLICLASAIVAIIFWQITKMPVLSVILVTVVDVVSFLPTVRKSIKNPFEETISMYSLSAVKFVISLMALRTYSLLTAFFPAVWAVICVIFVAFLKVRREQLKHA